MRKKAALKLIYGVKTAQVNSHILFDHSNNTDYFITATLFGIETPPILILEQPKPNYRFRFASEGVVDLLQGIHSTVAAKTFPKIQVTIGDKENYAKVEVVVSCVSHNEDTPRVHPYMVANNKGVRIIILKL